MDSGSQNGCKARQPPNTRHVELPADTRYIDIRRHMRVVPANPKDGMRRLPAVRSSLGSPLVFLSDRVGPIHLRDVRAVSSSGWDDDMACATGLPHSLIPA